VSGFDAVGNNAILPERKSHSFKNKPHNASGDNIKENKTSTK